MTEVERREVERRGVNELVGKLNIKEDEEFDRLNKEFERERAKERARILRNLDKEIGGIE